MYKHLFTAAFAATLAMPASAGNWAIAAPTALPEDGGTLKDENWQFFLRQIGPGDRLGVFDATEVGQIAMIAVPDEPRFESPKRRAKTFARENARIAAFFSGSQHGSSETDTLGVLRHIALNRIDPNIPLDVMIVGSALQSFAELPGLAMDQDGVLFVPSPDHLDANIADTAYGIGAEGTDGLRNVYLHMCPVTDDLRDDEVAALQGFYAAHVARREGKLVTWSDDLTTCFERLAAQVRAPLEIAPYSEPTGALEMIRVGVPVPEIIVQTAPSTVIMEGIEVDQFNLFASAPHPTLAGVEVTTGIVYVPDAFPDTYEKAYCYFTVQKSGAQQRLDLGEKFPGQSPIWERASPTSLDAAGVSRADFDAGRVACQWPET